MIDFENVDCFEKMKSMENNSIDLIMTDPPYGISFKGQTSNTDWDNMTDEEYSNFLFHLFFEFERILKDDGTIWLCCGRPKYRHACSLEWCRKCLVFHFTVFQK